MTASVEIASSSPACQSNIITLLLALMTTNWANLGQPYQIDTTVAKQAARDEVPARRAC